MDQAPQFDPPLQPRAGRLERRQQAQPARPAREDSAPPVTEPARDSGPPQVRIDRIEVITPPARPPEPDQFASLAARRAGASRHRGTG
jgi:hypothetical protein